MTAQIEDLEIKTSRNRSVVHIESSPRWVRAFVDGQVLADSKRVLLVFEPSRLPVYYFPIQDVRMERLQPSAFSEGAGGQSATARWSYQARGRGIDNIGFSQREPDASRAALKDHIAFYWSKIDAWFEEDAQVFVHPRDPYTRVDALPSSRHVKVVLDGEVVAETHHPVLLFETGLPTRYYIPRLDVRQDLLEPTSTSSQCPYKGKAIYWSVRVKDRIYPDLVWSYPFPIPECPRIEQLLAFYNEKVDLYVDGQLQERPATHWS
jgi:uncharacterized protein (DUF427 family)